MSKKMFIVMLFVFSTVLASCESVTSVLIQPISTPIPKQPVISEEDFSKGEVILEIPTTSVLIQPISTLIPKQPVISEEDFSKGEVILEIPKIQVESALKIAKQNQGKLNFSSLEENPILVETRQIGENGVALILGHRQWGIIPKIFAKLDRLNKGDVVIIRTEDIKMTFEVEESIVILPSTIWEELERLDVLFQETPVVVLMTCTPYGTSQKRLIVVAIKS